MNTQDILLNHCLIDVPIVEKVEQTANIQQALGTLSQNLLYYGYIPSEETFKAIKKLAQGSAHLLKQWWITLEASLKKAKGADKNIGKYIIYQNFPEEVLQMSEAEYWFKQLMIYWGVDVAHLRQKKMKRAPMFEKIDFKVLHLARPDSLKNIFESLLTKPASWIEQEQKEVQWFIKEAYAIQAEIKFKENLVFAAVICMQHNQVIKLSTTTDVLRLAVGFSAGDISLKTNTKFKLSRKQRKYILSLLEQVKDLEEGVMRHKNKWIRLFHQLHIGEYAKQYPFIYKVAKTIREGGKYLTFNSKVEDFLAKRNPQVLPLLTQRPGEFTRRIVHILSVFGDVALPQFLSILPQQETTKLLKLKRFLRTCNKREYRVFVPKGNWRKAQIDLNAIQLNPKYTQQIVEVIDSLLRQRVQEKFGNLFYYTPDIAHIKLPANDKEAVSRYAKGTVFNIPKQVQFIRTATYWQELAHTCWIDNGWNFFNAKWQAMGTCCWNNTHEMGNAAVFSGDPVNSYNKEGKAGQLIDLYIDKLLAKGVRYAIWNILSYSHIPFDNLADVQGLMMMGKKATKGQLIAPSRVNFSFPVTGKGLTKYICYIDLITRRIVLMDTNLWSNVHSAKSNEQMLEEKMPAIVEYLEAIPSLLDMFESFPVAPTKQAMKIVYTDENVDIKQEKAFVFLPKNQKNQFEPVSLENLMSVG